MKTNYISKIYISAAALGTTAVFTGMAIKSDPPFSDGYFYLKQILDLSNGKGFYFNDHSLSFLPPAILNIIIKNPLISLAACTAIAFFLFSTGLYNLYKRTTEDKNTTLPETLIILMTIFSFPVISMTIIHYKMLCASAATVWGWALSTSEKKHQKYTGFALTAAGAACHKAFLALNAAWIFAILLQTKKNRKYIIIPLIIFPLAAAIFHPAFITQLITVVKDNFLHPTYWQIALLSYLQIDKIFTPLYLLVFIFLFLHIKIRKKIIPEIRAAADIIAIILFICILPINKSGPTYLSTRLLLMTAPLAMAIATAEIKFIKNKKRTATTAAIYMLLLVFLIPNSLKVWEKAFQKKYSRFDSEIIKLKKIISKNDKLSAPQSFACYISYKTDIRAHIYAQEGENAYRIVHIPPVSAQLKDEIKQRAILYIGDEYILIKQKDWPDLQYHFPILARDTANRLVTKPPFF